MSASVTSLSNLRKQRCKNTNQSHALFSSEVCGLQLMGTSNDQLWTTYKHADRARKLDI